MSIRVHPWLKLGLWALPLAGYWAVLVYYLGAQWSVYEQYNYGWAVPFLCLYLIYRKAERLPSEVGTRWNTDAIPQAKDDFTGQGKQKAEKGQQEDGTTGPGDSGTTGQRGEGHEVSGQCSVVSGPFILWSLALCALLYAIARFLHEANPIWRLTSWLWALAVVGMTLLLLRTTDHRPQTTDHPSRSPFQLSAFSFSDFVFPICFFLVAVPWPSGLEHLLTQSLMRLNTATTVELLGFFGIPAVQHGNVIEISTGVVGIDEACSGIRSLQATLMLSLFFGEVYRLTVRRRFGLILLGFVLAFAFNVGRTLLLTQVASSKGVQAIASWHDPAGVTILVACFLSLWLIAWALQKAESRKQKAEMGTTGPQDYETTGPEVSGQSSVVSRQWSVIRGPGFSVSAFQRLSICLLAWLVLVEAGTELWYRSHERAVVGSTAWFVPRPAQNSTYKEVQIPPGISGQFGYDEGTHVRWEDGSGNAWQLYYFRWFPAHSLKKRVTTQLAKVHGPEKCLPAVGMTLRANVGIISVPIAGMQMAMQQYVFDAEGRPLHVFYGIYEDPSGSTKLANRRKDSASRVAAALAGSRNYGQRFLEVAVSGYERPEDARAALIRELEGVIKIDK